MGKSDFRYMEYVNWVKESLYLNFARSPLIKRPLSQQLSQSWKTHRALLSRGPESKNSRECTPKPQHSLQLLRVKTQPFLPNWCFSLQVQLSSLRPQNSQERKMVRVFLEWHGEKLHFYSSSLRPKGKSEDSDLFPKSTFKDVTYIILRWREYIWCYI